MGIISFGCLLVTFGQAEVTKSKMPFMPHLPLFAQIVPLMPERPYSHDKA
jgi:hypothetical protein